MTSAHTARPVLAVTLGDVAGIGPEIVAKTLLQHPDLREKCVPVVVGDADAMRAGAVRAGLDPDTVTVITDPRGGHQRPRHHRADPDRSVAGRRAGRRAERGGG